MKCCACAQVVESGDVGGVIKIWNVLDGVCTRTFGALTSHRPPIADLQWHPEQPELIAVMCARAPGSCNRTRSAQSVGAAACLRACCDAGRIGRYTPNVLAVWNVVSGVRQWLYDSKVRARRAKPSASRARRARHALRPSRTEARTPGVCLCVSVREACVCVCGYLYLYAWCSKCVHMRMHAASCACAGRGTRGHVTARVCAGAAQRDRLRIALPLCGAPLLSPALPCAEYPQYPTHCHAT